MLENSDILIRQRFNDCLSILNYIERTMNRPADEIMVPVSDELKNLRGLWLVQLYGAFEKSLNSIFSEVLSVVESSSTPINKILPSLKSIFVYPDIMSIKDCNHDSLIEKSINLYNKIDSSSEVVLYVNPLQGYLQNVDGKTILFLCSVLSIKNYTMDNSVGGRLGNLKERRNAVAHGRETPVEVGARFNEDNLRSLHSIVLDETIKFYLACKEYCSSSMFIKSAQ